VVSIRNTEDILRRRSPLTTAAFFVFNHSTHGVLFSLPVLGGDEISILSRLFRSRVDPENPLKIDGAVAMIMALDRCINEVVGAMGEATGGKSKNG